MCKVVRRTLQESACIQDNASKLLKFSGRQVHLYHTQEQLHYTAEKIIFTAYLFGLVRCRSKDTLVKTLYKYIIIWYIIQVLYMQKVSPGENFCQFCHLLFIGEICIARIFLSHVEYIEGMTTLVKIYSTVYFCNTKVAGVGEIFVQ